MTNKRKRIYEIIITALCITLMTLCAYMGITAIQKSMKLNVGFSATPSIECLIEIQESNGSYSTIFRNDENTTIGNGLEIRSNTLLFTESFANAQPSIGTQFVLKFTNLMTHSGLKVTETGTSASSNPTTVTMKAFDNNENTDSDTATMTISGSKASTLELTFSEYNAYSVTINSTTNNFTFNGPEEVEENVEYQATLKAKEGYTLSIAVERENNNIPTELVEETDYSWDNETLVIYAHAVTGNILITCSNNNVISYNISYNLNGGSETIANPTTYNIETNSFTLNNPTKTGYTFTGWTGSNGTSAQTSVTVSKGSTGNKSYIANWIASSYNIYANLGYTKKLLTSYTYSSTDNQYKTCSTQVSDSIFTSLGGWISAKASISGSPTISGTSLTIPAGTTGDIILIQKGYFLGSYIGSGANSLGEEVSLGNVYYPAFNNYKFIQFFGAESYNQQALRWIIVGGGTHNAKYGDGSSIKISSDGLTSSQLLLFSERVLISRYYDNDANDIGDWASSDCELRLWLTGETEGNFLYDSKLSTLGYSSKFKEITIKTAFTPRNDTSRLNSIGNQKVFLFATNTAWNNEVADNSNYDNQNFLIENYFGTYTQGDATSNLKMFSFSGANTSMYWTRCGTDRADVHWNSFNAYRVNSSGSIQNYSVYNTAGVRPCVIFEI